MYLSVLHAGSAECGLKLSSLRQKGENILGYVYLPTVAEYIVTNDLTQSSLL